MSVNSVNSSNLLNNVKVQQNEPKEKAASNPVKEPEKAESINYKKTAFISGAVLLAGLGIFLATRGKKGVSGSQKLQEQVAENVNNISKDGFEGLCKQFNIDANMEVSPDLLAKKIRSTEFGKYLKDIDAIKEKPEEVLKYLKDIFENPIEFKFPQGTIIDSEKTGIKSLEYTIQHANDAGVPSWYAKANFLQSETPIEHLEKLISYNKNSARETIKVSIGDIYNRLVANIDNPEQVKIVMNDLETALRIMGVWG